jgi:hypothetical protein
MQITEVFETVDHVHDLGVIFDRKLSFAQHISGIVSIGAFLPRFLNSCAI